ncbi:MAG: adenylate/guanylate cyclase domain-containing protein [Rhizobiaceae bacterium]
MSRSTTDQATVKSGFLSEAFLARLRLSSGVVLFTYVCWHLINHAFGLISDQAMRQAGGLLSIVVSNWVGSLILYTALTTHILLSLLRLYQRRSLNLKVKEWFQIAMGVIIPYFLISHVVSTRYANAAYDLNSSYDYVIYSVFVASPDYAIYNALGLIAAWIHGCIGMHMWFQTTRWYSPGYRSLLLFLATLIPTLSLTGYLAAGRRMEILATDGDFLERYYAELNLVSDDVWSALARDVRFTEATFLALFGILIVARIVRRIQQRRSNTITIDYIDGPTVTLPSGPTLLEMSKLGNVPHANVCGGKGRCSTCRVRIVSEDPKINPPSETEQRVLQRVKAGDDIRLACQATPASDMTVLRLLPSDVDKASSSDYEPWSSGREKVITVMFADLRDFTKTSESRLPFDVVYLINQFSKAMGEAVEANNGRIDKFLGDGFMALFGVDETRSNSAADAIKTAGEMIRQLNQLNQRLEGDLAEPLRMGIGIHTGSVILGNMGYGHARGLTAIGDTVNTASRLESATKEQKCILCLSQETMDQARMEAPKETKKRIVVRGKKDKLRIYALNDIDQVGPMGEKAKA